MTYELAIFDFDGTLAGTFPWFLRAVNRMADKHGFKRIGAGDIEMLRGYSARQVMAYLGVPVWKLPMIKKELSDDSLIACPTLFVSY